MKRRHLKVGALVSVLTLLAAACGDDGGGEGDGDSSAAVVRHAAGSTADAYIPQYRAPELFGDQFNISTEENIQLFEEGEVIGEIGLIDGQPRSAGADTLTETRMSFIPRHSFLNLIVSSSHVQRHIILSLC